MRPLVVIGDALLDVDLDGRADRLAPDAPVPVVHAAAERVRAGGAGLAATLAAASGDRPVTLVTALAGDDDARRLAALLDEAGVRVLPVDGIGATVRKARIRSGGQTLVRLDSGDLRPAPVSLPEPVRTALTSAAAILVADYGHGLAAHPELRRLLATLAVQVPVVWDPHPNGPPPVPGVRLALPNQREARLFAARAGAAPDSDHQQAARDAAALVRDWRAGAVAVTLGERGALLSVGTGVPTLLPVPLGAPAPGARPDPCGAGDCLSAAAALALAAGSLPSEAVAAGVRRASEYVRAGGQRPPERRPAGADAVARTREDGGIVVATGGCFDLLHAGHVELLRQARALGDCLVVCLNSDASVRGLKGPGRPLVAERDRVLVLEALDCVDGVVVFDERTPDAVIERLRPDLWIKGGDYSSDDLPEAAVVRRHGGEVVLLPYLSGHSTTELVARAAATPREAVR